MCNKVSDNEMKRKTLPQMKTAKNETKKTLTLDEVSENETKKTTLNEKA